MKNIVIRDSSIHGRGVFAEKDIQMGETIIDWNDCAEVLNEQQVEALPDDERKYLSFIDGQHILFMPPARFVNHSCSPSARGGNGHDVAIRHIVRGAEITVDYIVEQVPGLNLQCTCGASNCRGFLKVTPANSRGRISPQK